MKTDAAVKRKIQKLREQIAELDRLYYQQNRPAISDLEYDFLRKDLEILEARHPEIVAALAAATLVAAASPTQRVGDDRTAGFATARHLSPMLRLENTYSRAELEAFDARLNRALELSAEANLDYVVEPKIDGVSVSVVYENGRLARAVTRGDGEEGDVVTDNFLMIAGVPREFPPVAAQKIPLAIELRGEVFLSYSQFQKINAEVAAAGGEEYANPRNLAAGTLKLKDNPEEVRRRGLQVIFYTTGAREKNIFPTQAALLQFLQENNFPTHERWWSASGIQAVWQAIQTLDTVRGQFAYPTDGAVIKLSDVQRQDQAGFTARAPRWAFAYKYAPERAPTLLTRITVQVGRTGVLTPVAELTPVALSGSIVARATLHNADEIARKDIREGDTVIVEKAGEVIPAVVSVVLDKRPASSVPFVFPARCPACAQPVHRAVGEVAWRCTNAECPEQLKRALEHFASRSAMSIDELGEVVVGQLVASGLVKNFADLYTLDEKKLQELDYFQAKLKGVPTGQLNKKSADNLLSAIAHSRSNDLWRLLHGLGIPQVGETVSQLLAREFADLASLRAASVERLLAIHGLGESMAHSIVAFFADPKKQKVLDSLASLGVNTRSLAAQKSAHGPLSGQKFVLTGQLESYTRSAAKEKLEALGATVVDTVSAGITALIAGADAGSKLSKAQKLGLKILNENEFKNLLG